ncbi:MAG: hypothetical protein M0005_02445 [Actinomycetota bacterium]|jgi:hypothetical protein|nr:hypothetical protein [Actinomycetota bacterium]
MPKAGRLALAVFIFALAFGLGVWGVAAYLRIQPPNVNFTSGHRRGQPVDLTVQTVGSYGHGVHADWVSYLVKGPNGHWVHSTQWELPAHTRINVTVYQYDTGSPLRNQVWGLIRGTGGHSALLNGRRVRLLNSNVGNGVAHTFSVPALGVSVPLWGIAGNAPHQCAAAPCSLRFTHNVIKFSFYTTHPGQFRWQCFVPCAAGYLNGNGGPMDTLGYMAGFLKVI